MATMGNRDFEARACELGETFAARAAGHDEQGQFVAENFAQLRCEGFLGALVPASLGGGGVSYGGGVNLVRALGRHCGSTALTLSMHSHLVAAAVWKHVHGKPGEALLRRVAQEQLVLVSTGAGDWLQSNGRAERVDGGYRIFADKHFGSGSATGDIMISSVAYDCPDDGPSVLHFALPFSTSGVQVRADWDSMGMRGTGSNTIHLEGAFVPDQAIALKRSRVGWNPAWSVVLTVAPGLYMAPYVGIADAAAERARAHVRKGGNDLQWMQLGRLENQLALADMALAQLVGQVRDYDFSPDLSLVAKALTAKTLISDACQAVVDQAMEIIGGASYLRKSGLERLQRDVRAAPFHPLPAMRQQLICGRLAAGLPPEPEV